MGEPLPDAQPPLEGPYKWLTMGEESWSSVYSRVLSYQLTLLLNRTQYLYEVVKSGHVFVFYNSLTPECKMQGGPFL